MVAIVLRSYLYEWQRVFAAAASFASSFYASSLLAAVMYVVIQFKQCTLLTFDHQPRRSDICDGRNGLKKDAGMS